jgi:hypothetical protein
VVRSHVGEEADCDNLPLTLVKQDIEGREPPPISQLSKPILTTTGLTLCSAHTEPQHVMEVVTDDSTVLIFAVQVQPAEPVDIKYSEAPVVTLCPQAPCAVKYFTQQQFDDHLTNAAGGMSPNSTDKFVDLRLINQNWDRIIQAARDGYGGGKATCQGVVKRIDEQFLPTLFCNAASLDGLQDVDSRAHASPEMSAIDVVSPVEGVTIDQTLATSPPSAAVGDDLLRNLTAQLARQEQLQMALARQLEDTRRQQAEDNAQRNAREAQLLAQVQKFRSDTGRCVAVQDLQISGDRYVTLV